MLRDPPPSFLCPISPPRLSPPALTARLFSMAAAAAAADVGPGLRVSEDRILWLVRSHWVETRRTDRFHHALVHITSAATLNFCSGASAACPWPLNWSTPLWILIQTESWKVPTFVIHSRGSVLFKVRGSGTWSEANETVLCEPSLPHRGSWAELREEPRHRHFVYATVPESSSNHAGCLHELSYAVPTCYLPDKEYCSNLSRIYKTCNWAIVILKNT